MWQNKENNEDIVKAFKIVEIKDLFGDRKKNAPVKENTSDYIKKHPTKNYYYLIGHPLQSDNNFTKYLTDKNFKSKVTRWEGCKSNDFSDEKKLMHAEHHLKMYDDVYSLWKERRSAIYNKDIKKENDVDIQIKEKFVKLDIEKFTGEKKYAHITEKKEIKELILFVKEKSTEKEFYVIKKHNAQRDDELRKVSKIPKIWNSSKAKDIDLETKYKQSEKQLEQFNEIYNKWTIDNNDKSIINSYKPIDIKYFLKKIEK